MSQTSSYKHFEYSSKDEKEFRDRVTDWCIPITMIGRKNTSVEKSLMVVRTGRVQGIYHLIEQDEHFAQRAECALLKFLPNFIFQKKTRVGFG